jgi:hypothetical protein
MGQGSRSCTQLLRPSSAVLVLPILWRGSIVYLYTLLP